MAKEKLTYAGARTELLQIQQDLEDGKIGIDELSEALKRAKNLLDFCQEKLRSVEAETNLLDLNGA